MEGKRRILYLSAFNSAEAGNRVLLAWIKRLREEGHGVTLACPSGGWLEEHLAQWPDLAVLPVSFRQFSPADTPALARDLWRLVRFIRRHRTEIIHCNSEVAYYLGRLAARLAGRPIVTHFRFHFTPSYYRWAFKGGRRPDGVFFVSRFFLEEEREKLASAAPGARAWVLHNCLDRELFDRAPPARRPATATPFRVLYPAAIQERKNQLHLFDLDERLRELGIETDVVSAGKVNDPDYWESCRQRLQQPGCRVTFLGQQNDVFSLYAEADVSVSLSSYETFGMSVLESMAAGVPVVYYDIPPLREVVGESGIAVPEGDTRALSDAVASLLSDSGYRSRVGAAAQKRARELFSPEAIVPSLLQRYGEVAS